MHIRGSLLRHVERSDRVHLERRKGRLGSDEISQLLTLAGGYAGKGKREARLERVGGPGGQEQREALVGRCQMLQ